MNEPQETYTFSRALHLMRYGNKKMRCTLWPDINDKMWIDKDIIYFIWKHNVQKNNYSFKSEEIMGNWVIVV